MGRFQVSSIIILFLSISFASFGQTDKIRIAQYLEKVTAYLSRDSLFYPKFQNKIFFLRSKSIDSLIDTTGLYAVKRIEFYTHPMAIKRHLGVHRWKKYFLIEVHILKIDFENKKIHFAVYGYSVRYYSFRKNFGRGKLFIYEFST